MATGTTDGTEPRTRQDGGSGPPAAEPSDYAAINAVYAVGLAALAVAVRNRDDAPIRPTELVPMGAATFALSKVIAREKIGSWVREPFVEDAHQRPRR